MLHPDNTSVCCDLASIHGFCFQTGLLSFTDSQCNGVWFVGFVFGGFWIWNTSLLLPLLIVGQALGRWFPTAFPKWFAPMWLWFVVPNIVVLQPWPWDNTKFFVFWALLGSVVVGGVLAGLLRLGSLTPVVAVG